MQNKQCLRQNEPAQTLHSAASYYKHKLGKIVYNHPSSSIKVEDLWRQNG